MRRVSAAPRPRARGTLAAWPVLVAKPDGRLRSGPAGPPVARHVVLVTLDTLRVRPSRLLRKPRRRDAEPGPHRAAKALRAPEATVHVPLTRPSHTSMFTGLLSSRARDPRQRLAEASLRGSAPWPSASRGRDSRPAGFVSSIVVSRQSGLEPRLRHLRRRFEGGDRRRALPQHAPEAGRRDDRGGGAVAGGPARRPPSSSGSISTIPTTRTSRPSPTLAVRRPSLRRGGGVDRRADRPVRRGARLASGCGTTRCSS